MESKQAALVVSFQRLHEITNQTASFSVQRGLYQRTYVDKLLADPEAHFTRIQGSKLWHLALLEWWLQVHVDGVSDTAGPSPA